MGLKLDMNIQTTFIRARHQPAWAPTTGNGSRPACRYIFIGNIPACRISMPVLSLDKPLKIAEDAES